MRATHRLALQSQLLRLPLQQNFLPLKMSAPGYSTTLGDRYLCINLKRRPWPPWATARPACTLPGASLGTDLPERKASVTRQWPKKNLLSRHFKRCKRQPQLHTQEAATCLQTWIIISFFFLFVPRFLGLLHLYMPHGSAQVYCADRIWFII